MRARPVFIVGCPGSGMTLLHSMLMASGGFADYREEPGFYLASRSKRRCKRARAAANQRFARELRAGHLGRRRGVDLGSLAARVLARCGRVNDRQSRLQDEATWETGSERWLEAEPHHVLHMAEIGRAVPDALFIHIIRDGRDCVLRPTPRHRAGVLPLGAGTFVDAAAASWEWMVRAGRAYGAAHPAVYQEIRFENLAADPSGTLCEVAAFIGHDLDYDRVARRPVLSEARRSVGSDRRPGGTHPPAADVRRCEALIGSCLRELGYPLADGQSTKMRRAAARATRALYFQYFTIRHWLVCSRSAARSVIQPRLAHPFVTTGADAMAQ